MPHTTAHERERVQIIVERVFEGKRHVADLPWSQLDRWTAGPLDRWTAACQPEAGTASSVEDRKKKRVGPYGGLKLGAGNSDRCVMHWQVLAKTKLLYVFFSDHVKKT